MELQRSIFQHCNDVKEVKWLVRQATLGISSRLGIELTR